MMPGELAVLERLALELEILNRRTELEQAEQRRPDYQITMPGQTISEWALDRIYENRRYLEGLRLGLATAIARRKP